MGAPSIPSVHRDKTSFQEGQPLLPELQDNGPSPSGSALHEIFNQDIIDQVSVDKLSEIIENETLTPSLWNKILSWFKETELVAPASPSSTPLMTSLETSTLEPIHPTPTLEAPDSIPTDLEVARFSPPSPKIQKNRSSVTEIEEALALMSDQTIESIMFILAKAQIELEKENAHVAEGTFAKYVDFQKLQQKVLQEIKDALMKDERIAQKLKYTHNVVAAATLLAGLAGAVIVFGISPPAIVSYLANGPAIAVANALSLSAKAYFQYRFNQDKAKHEEYNHRDKYYNDRLDDSRNRLIATAESDSAFKEHWIRFLKRSDKMRKIVLKK